MNNVTAIVSHSEIEVRPETVLLYSKPGRRIFNFATADELLRGHFLSYFDGRLGRPAPYSVPTFVADYSPATPGYSPVAASSSVPSVSWGNIALLNHADVSTACETAVTVLSDLIDTVLIHSSAISRVVQHVLFFQNLRLKPEQPFSTVDTEVTGQMNRDAQLSALPTNAFSLVRGYILSAIIKAKKTNVYDSLIASWSTPGYMFHPDHIPYLMVDEAIDSINAASIIRPDTGSGFQSIAEMDARIVAHCRELRQLFSSLRARIERVPRCLEAYAFAFFNDSVELGEFSFDEFKGIANMLPATGFGSSGVGAVSRFTLQSLPEDVRMIHSLLVKGSPRLPIETVPLTTFKEYFDYFDFRSSVASQGQHFSFLMGKIRIEFSGRRVAIVSRAQDTSMAAYSVAERSYYDQRQVVESFISANMKAAEQALSLMKAGLIPELGTSGDLNWIGDERMLVLCAMACSDRVVLRAAHGAQATSLRYVFRRRADSPATLLPSFGGVDTDMVFSDNPASVIALSDRRPGGTKSIVIFDELLTAMTERTHLLADRASGLPLGARLSHDGLISIPQWDLVPMAGNTLGVGARGTDVSAQIFLSDFEDAAPLATTHLVVAEHADVECELAFATIKIIHDRYLAERTSARYRAVIGSATPSYARYHMGILCDSLVWRNEFGVVAEKARRRSNADMIFDEVPAVLDARFDLNIELASALLRLISIGRPGQGSSVHPVPAVLEFWQWLVAEVFSDSNVRDPHLIARRYSRLGTAKKVF